MFSKVYQRLTQLKTGLFNFSINCYDRAMKTLRHYNYIKIQVKISSMWLGHGAEAKIHLYSAFRTHCGLCTVESLDKDITLSLQRFSERRNKLIPEIDVWESEILSGLCAANGGERRWVGIPQC